ncbi:protease inhibitor I9 family protein [Streptomyces sp. NPDC058682]|uniref:protease inhibitor I9 family protein n=1 Tax=Streptomyces sp. NPDC058682 TaxID=3346596 RepID=UPI00365B76DF
MRIRLSRALPVAFTALAAVATPAVAATTDVPEPVPHTAPADHATYIVTVRKDVDPAEVAERVDAAPVHVYRTVLHGFSARLSPEQVEALRAMPDVETVEEDSGATGFGTGIGTGF